jgi:hypothetical protein
VKNSQDTKDGILLGLLLYKENWLVMSNAESGEGYSDILIEYNAHLLADGMQTIAKYDITKIFSPLFIDVYMPAELDKSSVLWYH